MTRKQHGKLASAIFAVFILLIPTVVSANHFELSRLANQLDLISSQLAYELRYNNAYSSVRSRAKSLSRESGQLFDALQRNRSNSSIRSHFKDVSRRYDKLEEAFFRANRKYYDDFVYRQVDIINQLFSSLNSEYYYAYYSEPRSSRSYYSSGRSYAYIPYSPRFYSSPSRSSRSRVYSSRRSTRAYSGTQILNRPQQAIPQVFRGDRNRSNDNRNRAERPRNRQGNAGQARAPRDNFDQSSPVLDRQARQDRDRRQTGNRVRSGQSRSPVQAQRDTRSARVANTPQRAENRVRNVQPRSQARANTRSARVADTPRRVENRDSNRQRSSTENRRGIDNQGNRSRTGSVSNLRRNRNN